MLSRTEPVHALRPRAAHIWAKAADGFYVEPSWCVSKLFEFEPFECRNIWDPACGWGTVTTTARRFGFTVYGSDIVDRGQHRLGRNFRELDFFSVSRLPDSTAIVCNPPYDLIEEFAVHACELDPVKVAMLMPLRRIPAAGRWLRQLPLKRIWVLTPRPSIPPGEHIAAGYKATGGSQDFAWLIFERGCRGEARMCWLNRDSRAPEP
jgi:hypothetical protein